MKNFVRMVEKPFTAEMLYENYDENEKNVMREAMRCRLCEHPSCTKGNNTDIRGIMRRIAVGNFAGAQKRWRETSTEILMLEQFEARCICSIENDQAVKIRDAVAFIEGVTS